MNIEETGVLVVSYPLTYDAFGDMASYINGIENFIHQDDIDKFISSKINHLKHPHHTSDDFLVIKRFTKEFPDLVEVALISYKPTALVCIEMHFTYL